jgi:hypothetical protein
MPLSGSGGRGKASGVDAPSPGNSVRRTPEESQNTLWQRLFRSVSVHSERGVLAEASLGTRQARAGSALRSGRRTTVWSSVALIAHFGPEPTRDAVHWVMDEYRAGIA